MDRHLGRILVFLPLFVLGGCVSVNIGAQKPEKSHELQLVPPEAPFRSVKSESLDGKWQNPKNGNIISILSDCNNPTDPSLENIRKGILNEIDDLGTVESQTVDYNGRKGDFTIVEGTVDGIPSRLELMIFKKHNCTYILTYAAVAKSYGDNQKVFKKFLKDFVVP